MTDRGWWRGAVIYQIYPRSFFDGNGDGVGDLAGIAGKLDHVARLGVDAVWLSPFFVSPMKDFGYDVADYKAIDPVFGTLADFDRLVRRAHELGLKVLIDQVWSHSSDRHPWFLESRASREGARADWYVWADPKPDGTPPNNWLSVFGGSAWSWEPRRRQYYLHHFLASQPQLNLRNPAVAETILEVGAFWLERGVDGFRLDAIDFLMHDESLRDNPPRPPADGLVPAKPFGLQHHHHDMLQPEIVPLLGRIRGLMDRYPGTTTLAEVSSQDGAFERVARYTAGETGLHMAYTLRPLRGAFDRATLLGMLEDAAALGRDGAEEGGAAGGWACWSFSNHDVERAVSRWNPKRGLAPPDPAFARMLMALLLSLRGSVCVYQGEELGLTEAELRFEDLRDPFGITYWPEFRGRDGSRTPLPWRARARHAGFTEASSAWLPVPPEHHALAVDVQEEDAASLLHAWRRFLAWRKTQPTLLRGSLRPLGLPEPLLGFERTLGAEWITVVFNLSDAPVRLDLGACGDVRPLAGHGFEVECSAGAALLPPYGVLFAGGGVAETARDRVLADFQPAER
jgi:alpha-glucosidase